MTSIQYAMEALCDTLSLAPEAALALLVAQPALLYDVSAESLQGRVDALATTFELSSEEAVALAVAQPVRGYASCLCCPVYGGWAGLRPTKLLGA